MLAFPALAHADAPRLELKWEAPAGCPQSSFVLSEIERLIGESPSKVLSKPMRVQARLEEEESGWMLKLEVRDRGEPSSREIRTNTCEEAARAAALILAIAIDPEKIPEPLRSEAVARFALVEPLPASKPPTPEAQTTSEPPPPQTQPSPHRRADSAAEKISESPKPNFAMGLQAAIDVGSLPKTAPGIELAGAVGWARIHLKLVASYFPPQRAESTALTNASGDVSLATGAFFGCYSLRVESPELAACAGAESGALWGRGSGAGIDPASDAVPWLAVDAALVLGIPINKAFAVSLEARAVAPIGRANVIVRRTDGGKDRLHRPAVVEARGALGLELRFR
ncbi:MAG TPA: hypothetical protein VGJ84_14730 [Polyangiaceae bacterium]